MNFTFYLCQVWALADQENYKKIENFHSCNVTASSIHVPEMVAAVSSSNKRSFSSRSFSRSRWCCLWRSSIFFWWVSSMAAKPLSQVACRWSTFYKKMLQSSGEKLPVLDRGRMIEEMDRRRTSWGSHKETYLETCAWVNKGLLTIVCEKPCLPKNDIAALGGLNDLLSGKKWVRYPQLQNYETKGWHPLQ